MNKIIPYFKKNLLKKIAVLMIILSIVATLIIYIKNPHKLETNTIYDKNNSLIKKEVEFPLIQNIKFDKDFLNLISIYFDDDSINNYDYNIKIYDENDNILFEQKYKDYESNIVLIDARNLKKNKNYKLIIDCPTCENVKMAIGKSINHNNIIEGSKKDTLKITIDNYEKNRFYYILPAVVIFISLLILIFIKFHLNDKILKKLKINHNVLIIYILILLSIILMMFIKLVKPEIVIQSAIINTNKELSIKEVKFPIVQNINLDKEKMKNINVYFHDVSINNYEYRISVYDKDKNVLFSHDYVDYESDIVLIDAGPLKKDSNYQLIIECDTCENVKMAIGESIDKHNKIENTKKDALKLTVDSYKHNNNYYWYPLMIIAICLTLLPLARSKNNEKQ